jgi:hypothetical protein
MDRPEALGLRQDRAHILLANFVDEQKGDRPPEKTKRNRPRFRVTRR